jgi:thiamine pyrophosphokinase
MGAEIMVYHIFAGGEFDSGAYIKIAPEDKIICADSGLKHTMKMGIIPDIIIGDFDSYSGTLPDYAEIIRSVPEKDDTDTMLAVRTAISQGADRIKIYGALGGRFDHTVANIQTLKFALDNGCTADIESEGNFITMRNSGEYRFPKRENCYFSVFAYTDEVRIARMSGVKYTLENGIIRSNFPIGVSNEFISDEAILEIDSGTALVVISRN